MRYTRKTFVVSDYPVIHYQSLRDLITEIETCGGSFGDEAPNDSGYQFTKPEDVDMEARLDTPSKLELGCDEYTGASDRFSRLLGVPEPPVSTD